MGKLPSNLTYNDLNGAEALEILEDWFHQLVSSYPPFGQRHLTLPMARITLDVHVAVDMYVGGSVPVESPPEQMDITGAVTFENSVHTGGSVHGVNIPPIRRETNLRAEVNAAPVPGGAPPDELRERHGLAVPRPGYGDRETGRHLVIGDVEVPVDPFRAAPPVESNTPPPAASQTHGRQGIVADGYKFASDPGPVQSGRQVIPVDKGKIEVDMNGDGISHAGIHVSAGTHVASKKEFGDQKGAPYGSVSGVYDAGPAGLMRPGRSPGLYTDGRPRLGFGNDNHG
jgi:hypothetical protein